MKARKNGNIGQGNLRNLPQKCIKVCCVTLIQALNISTNTTPTADSCLSVCRKIPC